MLAVTNSFVLERGPLLVSMTQVVVLCTLCCARERLWSLPFHYALDFEDWAGFHLVVS
jgi:hypothetical protein